MANEKLINVQLDMTQLLQKFIASRVSKERELEIGTAGDLTRGFITGMDQHWVQMTVSSDLSSALVQIGAITLIRETGKSLSEYPDTVQVRVRDYAAVFTRIAQREMSRSK